MAIKDMGYYDYNGAMFAFGIVGGLSNVAKVLMYVSDGHGNTYQYKTSQVYDGATARINTVRYSSSDFVFNIRTDRDAMSGSPKQLSYNVVDPDDSSGRGRYHASFSFYDSSDNLLNSTPWTYTVSSGKPTWYQMHNSLPTPTISWDENAHKIRLSSVGNYRYMLRIVRKDRTKHPINSQFTPEVRDYAYRINMQSCEGTMGGKYTENIPHWQEDYNNPIAVCRYRCPWKWTWDVKVIVLFDSGANFTEDEKAQYYQIVQNAFESIASITGLSLEISSTTWSDYNTSDADETVNTYVNLYGWGGSISQNDCMVRIGNDKTMKFAGQGFWTTWAWSDHPEWGISNSCANINITRAHNYESIAHVISEEIYQSFGLGIDCFEYPLSIHWDPEYCNPGAYNIPDPYNDNVCWDTEVLRFWYHRNMCGWTPIDFINNVDTPCTLFKDYDGSSYYEFDLSALKSDTYLVYGWVAAEGTNNPGGGTWSQHFNWDGGWDDAPYSLHTGIEIVTSHRPDLFSWDTPKTKGGDYNVTASEWNRFQQYIKVMAQYKEINLTTSFEDVSPGQTFTAELYNNARTAIQEFPDGAGSYIPQVSSKTQITADTSSTNPANNNINKIVDEINVVN